MHDTNFVRGVGHGYFMLIENALQVVLGSLGFAIGLYALCKTDNALRERGQIVSVKALDNYAVGALAVILGGIHAFIGVFGLVGP